MEPRDGQQVDGPRCDERFGLRMFQLVPLPKEDRGRQACPLVCQIAPEELAPAIPQARERGADGPTALAGHSRNAGRVLCAENTELALRTAVVGKTELTRVVCGWRPENSSEYLKLLAGRKCFEPAICQKLGRSRCISPKIAIADGQNVYLHAAPLAGRHRPERVLFGGWQIFYRFGRFYAKCHGSRKRT